MRQQQRTLAKPVSFSGVGVHSGKTVRVTIHPAPVNHGIRFIRKDLPDAPGVKAHFNRVVDTSLATVIGSAGCIVSTIEHLMATFAGLAVDNARVELDGYEIPIMDGSASVFAEKIRKAGFQDQDGPKCYFVIKHPIALQEGDKSVVVYPFSRFRLTYSIEFPHPLIQKQTYSLDLTEKRFAEEISSARTFGFYQEVEYMKRFGLARGGSLDNAVVIGEKDVLNEGGLRFTDEFVRHKILDAIGDFSLIGLPILGHLVIKKSGHAFNHAFLTKFFEEKEAWEILTLHDKENAELHSPNAIAV